MAIEIDVEQRQVRTAGHSASFTVSERHRRMFIDGLDVIGASLTYRDQITEFAQRHWQAQPWVKDVARRTRDRLSAASVQP
jgi:3-isopropylmalate/(R)-2-methylmalate dehydratase small subunit